MLPFVCFFSAFVVPSAAGVRTCGVRSVVLCFPNNPCGTTLSAEEARGLADFLDAQLGLFPSADFSLVLDEVYLGITAPDAHHSLLSYASPRLLRNTLLVLSVSKGLGAMPGARAGFMAVFDLAAVPQLVKVQMACTANAASVSQVGLAASLQHIMDHPQALQETYNYYATRTAFCVNRLNEIGAKYFKPVTVAAAAAADGSSSSSSSSSASTQQVAVHPSGTFYVLADFRGWVGPGLEDDRAIQVLLRDQYKLSAGRVGLACVPGCAFALDSKLKLIRFSCAVELSVLQQAMDIVEQTVKTSMEQQQQQQQQ